MQSVSMIGLGRMGGALAIALSKAGYAIKELVYRSDAGPATIADRISPAPDLIRFDEVRELRSDIVFITSADPEIEQIANRIVRLINGPVFVYHASGSLSSEVLSELQKAGCETGSIHPLVSISDPVRGSERFAGAHFCVEGQSKAVERAGEIVANLGGHAFSIDTGHKALYHASAVTASGHLVGLIDVAIEMLSICGIAPDDAKRILLPLIYSTIENLETQSPSMALTGTYSRADLAAFERHMSALEKSAPKEIQRIFLGLAERSTRLAEGRMRDQGEWEKIRDAIRLALQNAK
jgi:predicted short-subunit dehydrogenase-like oxidoreductase (DUF2520 family)